MTIQDAPLAARRVAGYRVLRSLARDEHAEVLLGFREREGEAERAAPSGLDVAPGAVREEPATVALKTMIATPARWSALLDVLEALERARGTHVIEVLDVDTMDAQLCVIFERLPNGSLTELLALRERLDAGEVVTVVAPLAEALGRMHASGVAHGAVAAGSVMFRADGEPVLMGFGRSSLFPANVPEVVLERQPGVGADRRGVRDLACLLLRRVAGARSRAARQLVAELESCPEELVLDLLGRRLFEVAAAMPVRFVEDDEDVAEAPASARAVPIGTPIELSGSREGVPGLLGRIVPEAWVHRLIDGVEASPAAPLLAVLRRSWRSWSPGRRRIVLGAAVSAAVLGGALAIVPTAPPTTAGAAPAASGSADATTLPSAASAELESAVLGDDPLAAAGVLIAERERCFRSFSLLCLDGVDQPDSGALRDDRDTIRAAQQGGELPDALMAEGSKLAPELVQRLGDSALVRLAVATSAVQSDAASGTPPQREPASLLLVKGEAGWRIRDVIAAPTNRSAGN